MTDLEKMKKLYDGFGIAYEIEEKAERTELVIGEDWYWTIFQFKNGKYLSYLLTE